ncbi:hypothetical protein, partial [Streptococcus dysgalactiae]|uniref:hypothetical protein n=1 Tax=Streptococcus dysgalactiae TaxID=1334 RepID=UPI00195108B0
MTTLKDLLGVLKPDLPQLPNDVRTLMRTPRTTNTTNITPGKYCHLGIQNALHKFPWNALLVNADSLELQLHVDGISPFGSSRLC